MAGFWQAEASSTWFQSEWCSTLAVSLADACIPKAHAKEKIIKIYLVFIFTSILYRDKSHCSVSFPDLHNPCLPETSLPVSYPVHLYIVCFLLSIWYRNHARDSHELHFHQNRRQSPLAWCSSWSGLLYPVLFRF